MIFDKIENAGDYHGYGERLRKGLKFLADNDCAALSLGRHEVDGDKVFALVQEYETKSEAEASFEAHRKYADIQYLCSGEESIYYTHTDSLKSEDGYSGQNDCILGSADADARLDFKQGNFAVFFPQDAHKPGCCFKAPAAVRKIVVKVRL